LSITDQGIPLLYKVLISAAAVVSLLAAVGIFCICKKCRKNTETGTDSVLHQHQSPTARKVKSKKEPVYGNVTQKR
ncbi:hypothetical protein QQF64_019478, partial [Cirrhinus molitorella]